METKTPLVSLIILTYKQEHCILETLKSAVAQDYNNLEIVVSDDCSPDNTFEIVKDFFSVYAGPHKIILNRNEINLRIVGNYNKTIELAHGEYLVGIAGDDVAEPNRVRLAVEKLDKLGVLSVCFNMNQIDGDSNFVKVMFEGVKDDVVYSLDDYLAGHYISSGASRANKREIFEIFGMIDPTCPTEDSVLNLRAFLSGGLGYCPIPTINYRWDGNNISSPVSLLTRFNPVLIYNQYRKDLELARDKRLIDDKAYRVVLHKINHYKVWEVAIRDLFAKKGKARRLLAFIPMLLNPRLSIREKRNLYGKMRYWNKHNQY